MKTAICTIKNSILFTRKKLKVEFKVSILNNKNNAGQIKDLIYLTFSEKPQLQ
jgi:hypothetical protein